MKQNVFIKLVVALIVCTMAVYSLTGCQETTETTAEDGPAITDPGNEEDDADPPEMAAKLASGWEVGTIDNDLEMAGKLWEDHGFMNGSNVECLSNGNVSIFVDEDGSKDFEGNDMPSEGAGIILPLDSYDSIAGITFEVELELPAAFPAFNDGVAVAQTFGIFEKNPEKIQQQKGAFVNYGYCPGSEQFPQGGQHVPLGDHHFSFGGDTEVIMEPIGKDMGYGPLDKDLIRQTVTMKMEITNDTIEFSANGEEPYYVQQTSQINEVGSDFQLRIMTHAATVVFGDYDPAGAPYITIIRSVRINGEEILLCSDDQ